MAGEMTSDSASAWSKVETNYRSTRLKPNLEVMDLRFMKVDMGLVKRMLEVSSSLRRLCLVSAEWNGNAKFNLPEFGDAMKLHSSSLRRIILRFPSCVLPVKSSSSVYSDGGSVTVTAENMCIGSFQDFKALTYLCIPFDALFGPHPRTSISFSQLLPANIKELSLERCMFRTFDSSQKWGFNQIQTALDSGLSELAKVCPLLWRLGIGCLPRAAFYTLDKAWKNRRPLPVLKEKLKSGERAWNVTSGSDVALPSLDYEGSDWEWEDLMGGYRL
jgi:hypothetical protein